jgi:hypothetical protein
MSEGYPSDISDESDCSETRVVRTIKHGDTTYELFVGPCPDCRRHPVFRLMRTSGGSLSIYEISSEDFKI